MVLKFRHVKTETVREKMANAALPELEYALVKRHGKRLRWQTDQKAVFLDMAVDVLEASQEHMAFEVHVRSLCHSRGVTADYLQFSERFNMKRCVLVIGEIGKVPAPWAELLQPAVHLFTSEFNMLFIEVPAFATSSQRWLKFGPTIVRGALKFLTVNNISVLACGIGGALFLEMLAEGPPDLFGKTHLVHNLDLPEGSKVLPFPVAKIEDMLREKELQLWFTYNDEPPHFDRLVNGMPGMAYEALTKLQARLEGERRRGRRHLNYDEILISEKLNMPRVERVQRLPVGRDVLLVFSDAFLKSVTQFLQLAPVSFQDDMDAGLVADARSRSKISISSGQLENGGLPELPALRKLRLRPMPDQEGRKALAESNRQRLNRVEAGLLSLELSSPSFTPASTETRRKMNRGSTFKFKVVQSASAPALERLATKALEIEDDDGEGNDYQNDWLEIRGLL